MSAADDEDDSVGYGRPPKSSRFQKGQSGNLKGRPKGSRNLSTMVSEAAMEKVTINIKGKRRAVSKLEAAFIQVANKAAGGDSKATKFMTELLLQAEGRDSANGVGQPDPKARREADALILKAIKDRLKGDDHAQG